MSLAGVGLFFVAYFESSEAADNDLGFSELGIIEVPPVFGVSRHAHAAHNDKCRDSRQR